MGVGFGAVAPGSPGSPGAPHCRASEERGAPSAALVTQKHWLSPEPLSPRTPGGGAGAQGSTRGRPVRQTSGSLMPTVAARGPSPAPARRPTNPPKSAPSPQSRGSGAQVLPGPAETHGARSWARERTAGLKAQEAGEEEAFQNPLTPRGPPRPLPESAASPGHAVNGGWPDAAEARHRPRGPGPKPPAVPAVRPTRGETGTSHLVCGGTTAARHRLSGNEGIGSGPRPGHARPRRWPLGGDTDAGERQAVSGTGTRVIRLWTPPQRVSSPKWRRGTGGATHPGSLPARRPRGWS